MSPGYPPLPSSTHHRLRMDPTDTHSQEPEGDFQCSNPAGDENFDHSADELTSQTHVSLPKVTEDNKETKCGMGSSF